MEKLYENALFDSFTLPDTTWEVIEEAKESSIVDGKHILARLVGPSFLVNGSSANKRFYSEKLWNKAIDSNKERMESGLMLGTIGHEQPLDDQALLEGKASHRVAKMFIKNGIGMTEIHVLGTKAGQQLNTMLRGGMKFPVSSRAFGEYKGKNSAGEDVVDEDKYQLFGFDFVQTPGVSTAIPKVVEKLEIVSTDHETNLKDIPMDTKMLEALTAEKIKTQEDLNNALSENVTLATTVSVLEEKVAQHDATSDKNADEAATATKRVQELEESNAAYAELGEAASIKEALEAAKDQATAIADLGGLDAIKESLETVDEYKELGTTGAISEILKMVQEYAEIGTVEDIQDSYKAMEELTDQIKNEQAKSEADEFAKEAGIESDIAESLLGSMDKGAANKLLESLKSKGSLSESYKKPEAGSTKDPKEKTTAACMSESRGSRMFKNLS